MSARSTRKNSQTNWRGFVDVPLTESDKAAIRDQEKTFNAWEELFYTFIEQGYRVSLSYDTRNNAFVAALTGLNGSVNEGYTLTGRGDTLVKALLAVRTKCIKRDWGVWKTSEEISSDVL